MIAVTIGNNLHRNRFNVNPDTTIRQTLETAAADLGIDYSVGMWSLDGSTVSGANLDSTFSELGYTGEANHDKCFLINIVKCDNA